MPEQGCKPVNKYLPVRKRINPAATPPRELKPAVNGVGEALLKWIDKTLSR